MDMWEPYANSVRAHLDDGAEKIVFDRYHIMSHMGKGVDTVPGLRVPPAPRARSARPTRPGHTSEEGRARRADQGEGEGRRARAAFAQTTDVGATAEVDVLAAQADELGDPEAGLEGEEGMVTAAQPGREVGASSRASASAGPRKDTTPGRRPSSTSALLPSGAAFRARCRAGNRPAPRASGSRRCDATGPPVRYSLRGGGGGTGEMDSAVVREPCAKGA